MTALNHQAILADHDAAWHADRQKGIGGSDAGRIMAGDWHTLWLEKTGREAPEDLSNVLQVQLGRHTEAFNRAWFEKNTNIAVDTDECEGLEDLFRPWARANLDGLCDDRNVVWEGKHVSAFSKPEDIINRYYAQLQHCMAVAECYAAFLSVIYGNHKWEWYTISRDDDYIQELIRREYEFWQLVQNDTEPGNPAAKVAMVSIDDMREQDMSASNTFVSAAHDWLATRAAAKQHKDADKQLKECVEHDVKLAYAAGVKVKRSKNGALTVSEAK